MVKETALHIDSNYQRQTHIARNLRPLGLKLKREATLHKAKKRVEKCYYRLILMHLETIGEEIYNFCSFVRSGNTDVILMALMEDARISVEEKLFDCGVNDVVVGKQTFSRVLAKRIRAHLNHCRSNCSHNGVVRLKNTIVDFSRKEVWCNGKVHLMRGVLPDLLKYFLENRDRVITRNELMESPIWADSICSSAKEGGKTFDVNVGKLRKIIEPNPSKPEIILSVRGQGWILARGIIK